LLIALLCALEVCECIGESFLKGGDVFDHLVLAGQLGAGDLVL